MIKQQLRKHLAKTIAEADLKRWFDPLELATEADSLEIVVQFPHVYFAQWFQTKIKDDFEKQVGDCLGQGYLMRYCLPGPAPARGVAQSQGLDTANIAFPFGLEYTFEQFFTNQKNLLPLASAKDVAKSQEVKFNPFIVLGESGTGKSHLLRCMANEISRKRRKETIFLCSADELAELFQAKDGSGRMAARNRLAEHSYLFMDDLPGISNYPGLADELLSLVNIFALNKRQMVFSSSKPLADCEGLPQILRARLEGGLTVQLSKPDLDVRVKFVQDHCQRKSIGLTKAQMLTLAQRHPDFRTLAGMLNKFQAYRDLLKRDISDSIFENILGHGQGVARPKLSPQTIIYTVAKRFKLDAQDITGHSRKKGVVLARQTAMLLCREELGLSYPALGKLFGGKDHSTVLYSIKKMVKIQIDDQHMKQFVQEMRLSCRQER